MDTVIYDSDCALCTRVKETVEALDWFHRMRWISNQTREAVSYGIAREMLDHSVYLVNSDQMLSGFDAVQRITSRVPLTWFVAAVIIAKKPWAALLFAFLFSPFARPAGRPAYEWVARNRYRLPGSTCDNRLQ